MIENQGPGTEAPLTLHAATAADLMTLAPVSIRDTATLKEAVTLLTDRGFNACPVLNSKDQLIGVVSKADLLVHEREKSDYAARQTPPGSSDPTRVQDIMTPAVFSVRPDTSVDKVVEDLLALKVHQLFVVDDQGLLMGVISTLDIRGQLRR